MVLSDRQQVGKLRRREAYGQAWRLLWHSADTEDIGGGLRESENATRGIGCRGIGPSKWERGKRSSALKIVDIEEVFALSAVADHFLR